MSDVLNLESPEYKSEIIEGDCEANSTSATAGDSFRIIDCTEVNFRYVCVFSDFILPDMYAVNLTITGCQFGLH